jgi:hypothetical protein
MINHLSRQWLYPWAISELQHNLLYKTWTVGLRRRRRLLKKLQNTNLVKYKCTYITSETKTVTCYKTDPSSWRERCSMTTMPQWSNYSQNLVMSPWGALCQDGQADWLTVCCKVTQTHNSWVTVSFSRRTVLHGVKLTGYFYSYLHKNSKEIASIFVQ